MAIENTTTTSDVENHTNQGTAPGRTASKLQNNVQLREISAKRCRSVQNSAKAAIKEPSTLMEIRPQQVDRRATTARRQHWGTDKNPDRKRSVLESLDTTAIKHTHTHTYIWTVVR